jgi:HK97 family phage prohead protease
MHEMKSMPTFTKSIQGREVTGIFSVFSNVDHYADVAMPGSFTKTFKERGTKVYHLWMHSDQPPTAIVKSLREVSRNELPEDAKSAYPEATGGAEVTREYLDTPRADEIYAAIKAGSPLQMSYAYDPIKIAMETRDGAKVRLLQEQRLYETSDVIYGANDGTSAAKSLAAPSASKIRRALQSLKMMDGYDIWSECYDIYGAASALSSVAMLLDGEQDDAAQMAQLLGACRLLLAFIGGEIDSIEAGAQPSDMQLASRLVTGIKMQLKAGARNAASDQKNINAMHDLAIELGADNCAGNRTSGDKSRADPPTGASLTLLKSRLAYLDFATKE